MINVATTAKAARTRSSRFQDELRTSTSAPIRRRTSKLDGTFRHMQSAAMGHTRAASQGATRAERGNQRAEATYRRWRQGRGFCVLRFGEFCRPRTLAEIACKIYDFFLRAPQTQQHAFCPCDKPGLSKTRQFSIRQKTRPHAPLWDGIELRVGESCRGAFEACDTTELVCVSGSGQKRLVPGMSVARALGSPACCKLALGPRDSTASESAQRWACWPLPARDSGADRKRVASFVCSQ